MTLRSEHLDFPSIVDSKGFSMTVKPFRQCLFLLDELLSHYECIEFIEPVPEDASIYHKEIKNPMDLMTIEQKLFNNKYKAYYHFRQDLELIWTNATTFHRDFDEIYKEALMLKQRLINLETFLFENRPAPKFISFAIHNIESLFSEQFIDEKISYLHFPLYSSISMHRKSNLYFIRTIPEGSDPSREYKGFNNVIAIFNQLNFPFIRYLDNSKHTLPLPRFYIAKDRELLVKAINDPEGVIAVFLDVRIEPVYGTVENVLSFKSRVAIVEPVGEIHTFDEKSLPHTEKFENPPSIWIRFNVIRVQEVDSIVSVEMNRAILRGFYGVTRISTKREELKKVTNPELYTSFARDIIDVSLNRSKKIKRSPKISTSQMTTNMNTTYDSVNKKENENENTEHVKKSIGYQKETTVQSSATLCELKNTSDNHTSKLDVFNSLSVSQSSSENNILKTEAASSPSTPKPLLDKNNQIGCSSLQSQDTTQNVHTAVSTKSAASNTYHTSQQTPINNDTQKNNMYIASEVDKQEFMKKISYSEIQHAANKGQGTSSHEKHPNPQINYTNQGPTSSIIAVEQNTNSKAQLSLDIDNSKTAADHPFFDPKSYYKSIKAQPNRKPAIDRKKNLVLQKSRPPKQQTVLDQGFIIWQPPRQNDIQKKPLETADSQIDKQTTNQLKQPTQLQQQQQTKQVQLKLKRLQVNQQAQNLKQCEITSNQGGYYQEGKLDRTEDVRIEAFAFDRSSAAKQSTDSLIQAPKISSSELNTLGPSIILEKQLCIRKDADDGLLQSVSEKRMFVKKQLLSTLKQAELYEERSKYLFCELLKFSKRIHVPVKKIEHYCFDIKASPNAEGYFKQVYFLQDSKDKVVQTFRRMTTAQRVTEIASLLKLKNMPHIGQIIEVIEEQGEIIGLSMERYQKTLKQYAHPHSHHRLTAHQKMNIVVQLLECMKAIHDHGLAHRDLSEVNFMVNETEEILPDGSRKAEVYLIDFGKSNFVFSEDVNHWWIQLPPGETDCSDIVPTTEEELKEWCDQLPWMRAKPDHGYRLYRSIQTMPKSRADTQELPWLIDPLAEDVYSIGTIIWKIFTETEPWYGILETDIRSLRDIVSDDYNIEKALEREVPGTVSRQLLLHALKVAPQERKSAGEILKWIKNPEIQVGLIKEWQVYAPVDRQKRHVKRFSDEAINSMPAKSQKTGRINRSKAFTMSPS